MNENARIHQTVHSTVIVVTWNYGRMGLVTSVPDELSMQGMQPHSLEKELGKILANLSKMWGNLGKSEQIRAK